MSGQKYTFEDWKSGKITKDYQNGEIKEIESCKRGLLPYELYNCGLLSGEDYGEINKLKSQAFNTAVNLSVNKLVGNFEEKLSNVTYSKELLEVRIEELEETIDEAPRSLMREVYSEKVDISGIDFHKYLLIEHPDFLLKEGLIKNKPGVIHLSFPSDIADASGESTYVQQFEEMTGFAMDKMQAWFDEEEIPKGLPTKINFDKYVKNRLYDFTVNWRFLKGLKEISDSSEERHQSGYGTHQENRDWIMEKFEEQEKIQTSQNKAVIKVKELYKEEFGLSIGKTTILRMVGRAD